MTALIGLNILLWASAAFLLSGSVVRLLAGRTRGDDDVLALLSLLATLMTLFFARRIFLANDDESFLALSGLALVLAAYVMRVGWGRKHAGRG